MSDELEAMCEEGRAVQEVARAVGKTTDLARDFGGFIAKFVSGPLEQGVGVFEDRLRYMRWERQVRLMQRVQTIMEELGELSPTKPIPLKLAVPLFQAATLEDDDYLQDMWANLLVNSAVSKQGIELRRAYIDILERLSPLEALILEKLCALHEDELQGNGIITGYLPERAEVFLEGDDNQAIQPNQEVTLALSNLARLGCVVPQLTWGGGQTFTRVHPTIIGRKLVEAVQN